MKSGITRIAGYASICIATIAIAIFTPIYGIAQTKRIDSLITKYHRNSIYSLVLSHPGYKFGKEIQQEFLNIPVSDKYNNHNLSIRSFPSDDSKDQKGNIDMLLNRSHVSKRLVSKWFSRNKESGTFNTDLIAQRGFYDASTMDYNVAKQTVRGLSLLSDAGEELIGNTFVIVNDIQYIDKGKRAQKTSSWLSIIGDVADAVGGVSSGNTQDISTSISSLANSGSDVADLIAGFTVTITSYLYCLDWNPACASVFYEKYYFGISEPNNDKKLAYENDANIFSLKYVGKYTVKSSKTVLRGTKSNEEVIRKVCARALDENIVQLQRKFEPFRVKSPIYSVSDKTVLSPIGMKEGVNINSRYEVLEKSIDSNGKTHYSRVGIIKPIKGKIWDNRFMAVEEGAAEANLNYTEFKKVSGRTFYPGMLIREVK